MSDDFQRGLQARLAHLIGEASQWSRGSGAHPPGLVKALNEAFEYGCAEIERLQRERDALKAKNEQLREDAARYRLLRKGAVEDVAVVRGLGAMDYGMSAVGYTYSYEIYGDDLDAAIDAAMEKEVSND